MVIIGYSGHSYVVIDIFRSMDKVITSYCDQEEKSYNPYNLKYLGSEEQDTVYPRLGKEKYFIAIGMNRIRKKVFNFLTIDKGIPMPQNAIHSSAVLAPSIRMGKGVMIAANATVNPLVQIGNGAIINTACIVDHECIIGDFAHICPGATLAGNVTIGAGSFVGANSVVKQGVTIGQNVIVGAGCVVIRDIPDDTTVVGNPQKFI